MEKVKMGKISKVLYYNNMLRETRGQKHIGIKDVLTREFWELAVSISDQDYSILDEGKDYKQLLKEFPTLIKIEDDDCDYFPSLIESYGMDGYMFDVRLLMKVSAISDMLD